MGMEEGLLLDRITLHSARVSPRNVEPAATIEANLADSGLSVRNGAAVSAGKTADAVIAEAFDEQWIGFADSLVEDVAQGGHGASGNILARERAFSTQYSVLSTQFSVLSARFSTDAEEDKRRIFRRPLRLRY